MNMKTETKSASGRSPAATCSGAVALELVPVSFDEACEYIRSHHRHHKPPVGAKFCVAVSDGKAIRGVVIVGRPVARLASDGWTLEVTRLATDGAPNACSMLYRTAWRAAQAMGYRKLITYTLPEEGGASLRAAGLRCLGKTGGGRWSRKDRPRVDTHPLQEKMKWELQAWQPNNR